MVITANRILFHELTDQQDATRLTADTKAVLTPLTLKNAYQRVNIWPWNMLYYPNVPGFLSIAQPVPPTFSDHHINNVSHHVDTKPFDNNWATYYRTKLEEQTIYAPTPKPVRTKRVTFAEPPVTMTSEFKEMKHRKTPFSPLYRFVFLIANMQMFITVQSEKWINLHALPSERTEFPPINDDGGRSSGMKQL